MKAVKIKFSLPLLLQQLGLDYTSLLEVYRAEVDCDNNVCLYITGDHPDLPKVVPGEIPEAVIKCQRVYSKIEVVPDVFEGLRSKPNKE
jgi:hypothetical protein